ncbi:MAG TPA: hypothetical protein PK402_03375 [Tepidisphaeraceae bacterium]|nr:hypothetical protein [Tepidisphaeraceae bacterium]
MRKLIALAASAVIAGLVSTACADSSDVAEYLREASEAVTQKDFDEARLKIELAEASMDDVSDADRAKFETEIKQLKAVIFEWADGEARQTVQRKVDRAMEEAEDSIGNMVTWNGDSAELQTLLDDPDTTRLLGAEAVAGYQKKFATFKKVHAGKALKENLQYAKDSVTQLEEVWKEAKGEFGPDGSPNGKESAIEEMTDELSDVNERLAQLPQDDAEVNALRQRVATVATEFTTIALAEKKTEVLDDLKRGWELYENDWNGWRDEKPVTSWDTWRSEGSEKMSALGCPKTVELIDRSESWFENLEDNESYEMLKDDADVKAYVQSIAKDRAEALARMEGAADAIIKEVESKQLDEDQIDKLDYFSDTIDNNMTGSAKIEQFQARCQKIIDKFHGETAGADEATAKWYEAMKTAAADNWGNIENKFETTENFDPMNAEASKGKLIKFETDNLMGWRFSPGDFPFATTIEGQAIAGRYDPMVASAVKRIEERLGRSLGDDDNDGRWTVIARVEGRSGKLMRRTEASGDVLTDGGEKVGEIKAEGHEEVEAPIITIVAAHCGPLCVGSKLGMIDENGKLVEP